MGAQDKLFQLIKSLSPSEKRYYLLFVQRNGRRESPLYPKLFSKIDAQKKYDESVLKNQFSGTSFGKSLAFPKSHLYLQVLRALQSFHYEKSTIGRFNSYLDKIELLSDRGFPDQSLLIVEKRLKQALKLDLAVPVLQLLKWKRRLTLRTQTPNYSKTLAEVSELEELWEQLFIQEQKAIRLHDEMYLAMQESRRRSTVHSATDLLRSKQQIDHLLEQTRLTFETKLALCRANAHYAHLIDDFALVHQSYQQEVDTWRAHPHLLQLEAMRFVRTFGAWLNSKTLIQDYSNLLTEIQQIRQQKGMNRQEQALIFRITYSLELFYYLNSDQFEPAIALAPKISAGLERFNSLLSPAFKLGFYFNLSVTFWLGERPQDALKWTQRILHFEAGEIRKDIRFFAPLLEKVLQLECGYLDHLESWFRAFQYRKRKKLPPSQLETILFTLIRGLTAQASTKDEKILYNTFLAELEQYSQIPEVSKLALEELRIWAARKI